MNERDEQLEKEIVEIEAKLQANSMNGGSGRRNPNRKIKMKYSEFRRRIAAFCITVSIATGILVGLTGSYIRKMSDKRALEMIKNDFKETAMANMGDSSEEQAEYLKIAGDFDLNLYLLFDTLGPEATNEVLSHTYYGSIDGYLKKHKWHNWNDWFEDMKRVLLAKNELDQMTEEHQLGEVDNATYGGAK